MKHFSLFHSLHTVVEGEVEVMEALVKQEVVADGWSSSELFQRQEIVQTMVVLFLSFHLVVLV
jgi:hypothetical protein